MVLVPMSEKDEIERRVKVRPQERRERPRRDVGPPVDEERLPGWRRDKRRVPLPHVDEVDPQRPGRKTGGRAQQRRDHQSQGQQKPAGK